MIKAILCFGIMFNSFCSSGASDFPFVTFEPKKPIQGQPLLVEIGGVRSTSTIESIQFAGTALEPFKYRSKIHALYGVDLRMVPGQYELLVKFTNSTEIKRIVTITPRITYKAPLGIPDKLGGNTTESEKQLVNDFAKEAEILNGVLSSSRILWREKWQFPVSNVYITDPYGYTRLTGASTIKHKGTDFRAVIGTKVYAMNSGVVRLARDSRVYGKMVALDHGLGLVTAYLHLSQLNVVEGDFVKKGQLVGLSGDTGYAESPHLHLSVRINNVSIDPMKFMEFFK